MALESHVRLSGMSAFRRIICPPEQLPFSQNAGGEYTMSMAYLLAWQVPVLEEQDPYGDGYSPRRFKPLLVMCRRYRCCRRRI